MTATIEETQETGSAGVGRIAQLLEQLSEDQRRVIERRFFAQRSIREIAHDMGRSEGAIKQLQFRALETLRAQVRNRHE